MQHGGWTALVVALLAVLVSGGWLYLVPEADEAPRIDAGDLALAPLDDVPPDAIGRRFGALRLVGGGELVSSDPHVGGVSGLEASIAPSAFTARGDVTLSLLTDNAALIQAHILLFQFESGLTPLHGVARALGDESGRALAGKSHADSEGLALTTNLNGETDCFLVSFERRHRASAYCALDSAPPAALRAAGATPVTADDLLGDNHGLEALALLPQGMLLAGAERPSLDGAHPLWSLTSADRANPQGPWRVDDGPILALSTAGPGFGLTGMDAGPHGGLFVLYRHWIPAVGNSVVVGHVSGGQLSHALARTTTRPDATPPVLAPRELLRLTPQGPLPTDNFEGIAVTPAPQGGVLIWIVSDDNFRAQQRTLLYAFHWDGR